MKKNSNKGFSLIELIVVIAIMGVLTALGSVSFGAITGAKVKTAAKELGSKLDDVKTANMSKESSYALVIIKKADGYCIQTGTVDVDGKNFKMTSEEELDSRVKISVNVNGSDQEVEDMGGILIMNTKATGAFKNACSPSGTSLGNACSTIKVSRGDRTITLTLYKTTGKVTIDY